MPGRRSPWASGPALSGLAAGGIGAVLAWVLPPAGAPVSRLWASIAVLVAGGAAGLLASWRRRGREDARRLLDLQEEVRFSQEHIMANETYRSLSAYLEIAAHQMKDPLQGLVGGLKELAAETGLPDGVRGRVAALRSHGVALHETLRHLAGYALTKPGRAPFSVNILLHESILLCRQRAAEKKILFEERYATVPPVMGSAMRVHQALFNIIVNAVESMPFGGGTIVIETEHQGDRVIARVRDTGIGIRPEHLPQVFDPFFTTKPEKKGVGLGLWAARQMLDIIGADITIKSAPHQGTEVAVTFPQAAPLRPGREGTAHPPELAKNTADEGDRQIA